MKSLVVIDTSLNDYEGLLLGIPEGYEIFLIDSTQDGVNQLATYLAGKTGYEAIHLYSHGSSGYLYLGTTDLSQDNLGEYQDQLRQIGSALTDSGDILFYGCNVAEGEMGIQFITSLAQNTSADVAASIDLTGTSLLGGDVDLEFRFGDVSTTELITQKEFNELQLLLAIPPSNILPDTGTWLVTDEYSVATIDYGLTSGNEILYYRFIANDTGEFLFLVGDGFGNYAHNAK